MIRSAALSLRGARLRLLTGSRGGVVALVSGTAAAQVITVVATLVLARIYSPESFGIFAYIFSVCAVLTAVASLRFETAIPLAETHPKARAVTQIALGLPLVLALATMVLLGLAHEELSRAAGFDILPWAFWLPPLLVLTATFNVLGQAAIRERAYSKVARRTFVQSLGIVAGQLSAALVTRSAGGLLSGQLLGRSLGILSLARTARPLFGRCSAADFRGAVRAYWRFPCLLAPSALLNTLGTNLPLILVGAWFGPLAAGFLGLTQRIALVPTALVSVAVGQVFAGELASRLRMGQLNNRRLYLRTSMGLLAGGTLVGGLLVLAAGWAFPLVLGQSWATSGDYAQAIAPAVALQFIVSPVSYVLIAYQRAVTNVFVDLSRVLLVGGSGLMAHLSGFSAIDMLWAMSAAQALNYAVTWTIGYQVAVGRRAPGEEPSNFEAQSS